MKWDVLFFEKNNSFDFRLEIIFKKQIKSLNLTILKPTTNY